MEKEISKCILCDSQPADLKEVLSFEELKEIWKYTKIEIEKHLPPSIFLLKECSSCALQFFDPQISGDDDFYSLSPIRNYQFSWDYKVISRYILKHRLESLLDYGCGEGFFLKILPEEIFRVGIDFNVKPQKKENLRLIKSNLLDFEPGRQFEAVISVQVLEHLTDPKRHLRKMIESLKEGGYLFLSVPNRNGVLRLIENKGKPLDFPPHHLTRWSKKTMQKISEIYHLKIITVIEEPLSYHHFRWAMHTFIGTRYMDSGFKNKILGKILLLKQEVSLPISYPRFKDSVKGHSILAVFQK